MYEKLKAFGLKAFALVKLPPVSVSATLHLLHLTMDEVGLLLYLSLKSKKHVHPMLLSKMAPMSLAERETWMMKSMQQTVMKMMKEKERKSQRSI
jgi:hypothetical protein